MPRRALLPAWIVALLALPAAAPAAEVQARTYPCTFPPDCAIELVFAAAPGERNAVTITVEPDGAAVVADAGAPLTPGPDCVPLGDGRVRCAAASPFTAMNVETGDGDDVLHTPEWDVSATVSLGDGDDRFTGLGHSSPRSPVDVIEEAVGGPGNDALTIAGAHGARLRGDQGDDVLRGGDGNDELLGNQGRDDIGGGAGDDVLLGVDATYFDPLATVDTPAADELDGGAGRDELSFIRARRGVTVDLAAGRTDQDDVLRNIEDVRGGWGSDRLLGDAGANRLLGAEGADTLEGRGGDDLLLSGVNPRFLGFDPHLPDRADGGEGDDVLRAAGRATLAGGPGDDTITTGRARESGGAICGPGLDVVRLSRRTIRALAPDCERWALKLGFGDVRLIRRKRFPFPAIRRGAIRLTVPCPPTTRVSCRIALEVNTARGRRIARDEARVPVGGEAKLVVRLPADRPRRVQVVVGFGRTRYLIRSGVLVTPR